MDSITSPAVLPPAVVAIGGLDPSAAAGILADVRTLESFAVVPAAVVTAVTIESGLGASGFTPIDPSDVRRQIREVVVALSPSLVKVGQLASCATVSVVADEIDAAGLSLVLDPVLVASGGGALGEPLIETEILRLLVPRARVLTVNLDEAAGLLGWQVGDVNSRAAMAAAGEALVGLGAQTVVVKGGHLRGAPTDVVVGGGGEPWYFCAPRIDSNGDNGASLHGSGCAFASALSASLALGQDMRSAIIAARRHVRFLIRHSLVLAGGRRFRSTKSTKHN